MAGQGWEPHSAWVGYGSAPLPGEGRRAHVRHLPNFPNRPPGLEGQGLYSAEGGAVDNPSCLGIAGGPPRLVLALLWHGHLCQPTCGLESCRAMQPLGVLIRPSSQMGLGWCQDSALLPGRRQTITPLPSLARLCHNVALHMSKAAGWDCDLRSAGGSWVCQDLSAGCWKPLLPSSSQSDPPAFSVGWD